MRVAGTEAMCVAGQNLTQLGHIPFAFLASDDNSTQMVLIRPNFCSLIVATDARHGAPTRRLTAKGTSGA